MKVSKGKLYGYWKDVGYGQIICSACREESRLRVGKCPHCKIQMKMNLGGKNNG